MRSSKSKKQYKALLLDIDGTLISYNHDSLPSEKIIAAIKSAQKKLMIYLITGRSYFSTKPILDRLSLHDGYAALNNGAQILNLETSELLYEKLIPKKETEEIISLFKNEDIPIYIKQDLYDNLYRKKPYEKGDVLKKASMIYTPEDYSLEKIDGLIKKLSRINNINIHKATHNKGFGLSVQHASATKLHGIEIILKKLEIEPKDTIGIGDSYNDFPLLMACGLKVAMGNAVDDLKAIADYIAPSVEEDGVADVIEKFVL